MGRWMESLNTEGIVIDEIAPNPLIYCTKHLPKSVRESFPIINGLDLHSDKWKGELQVFKNNMLSELYTELIKLRKLTRMEEHVSGVDNEKFLNYWKGENGNETEFNNHLDSIENIIRKSIEQKLELRIYL